MADLITVQEYKNAEGLASQKDDQRLDIIVPQVSDLAKKYCGTSFVDYYSNFAKRYERGLKKSIEDGEMYDVDTELVSYILMGIAIFMMIYEAFFDKK